ncbi:MAG: SDR family NAD(P)-dependent oxidoreductase [Spirochaetota bacterium]|nr:SDR family NAD(P)-dependent oxidoreductase [Spirochaetota bacterium]
MNLKENTVLITGGSSGIGLELAKVLTEKQNKVIICGRSLEKLEQAKKLIPSLSIIRCDISRPDERNRLLSWVLENHPRCNILINNAAIVHNTNFVSDQEMISKAELETQINFIAPVALTKLFFPLINRNINPTMIYITTGLVYAPKAVYPIYNATKSALHSFVQTLRLQLKDQPINILEVLMPAVDTPWHKGNVPKIAISAEKAVEEMCRKLNKDKKEIRIGKVNLLYLVSRIAPAFALKKINSI